MIANKEREDSLLRNSAHIFVFHKSLALQNAKVERDAFEAEPHGSRDFIRNVGITEGVASGLYCFKYLNYFMKIKLSKSSNEFIAENTNS